MGKDLYLNVSKIVKKIQDFKIPLIKKGDIKDKKLKEYVEYESDKLPLGKYHELLGGWRLRWRFTAYGKMDWENKDSKILYLVDRFILSIRDEIFLIDKTVVKVWGFDWIKREEGKNVFDVILTVLPNFEIIQDPEK